MAAAQTETIPPPEADQRPAPELTATLVPSTASSAPPPQDERTQTLPDGRTILRDGGVERLRAASALHGESFKTDPVINFLLHGLPQPRRTAYVPDFLATLLKSAALNGATFEELWTGPKPEAWEERNDPPPCSAVWIPPRRRVDNVGTWLPAGFIGMAVTVGLGGLKRMLFEFQAASDRAKKEGLVDGEGKKIKDYHYLFFISTDVEQRGKGLSSQLIADFQERCEKSGVPIWLESTTEKSHRLYLKLGFKDVKTWKLGEGRVDENGDACKGGKGVQLWAMLWMPEKKA